MSHEDSVQIAVRSVAKRLGDLTRGPVPAAGLLVASMMLWLGGCGGQSDLSSLPDTPSAIVSSTDPYNNANYPTPGQPPTDSVTPRPVISPTPDATGSANPTLSPSPVATATASPSPLPSVTPILSDYGLRLVNIDKTTHGLWLWEKAELNSVQVQNPLLTKAQTGRLIVSFSLNGSTVEQPLAVALSLAPGEIKTFGPFKATARSDDSSAQVMTDGQ